MGGDVAFLPYAGIIRIRLKGCDLSPSFWAPPIATFCRCKCNQKVCKSRFKADYSPIFDNCDFLQKNSGYEVILKNLERDGFQTKKPATRTGFFSDYVKPKLSRFLYFKNICKCFFECFFGQCSGCHLWLIIQWDEQ